MVRLKFLKSAVPAASISPATNPDIQSKDSSATHLHMHQPRLADFFEEFTRPHTSTASSTSANPQHLSPSAGGHQSGAANALTYGSSSSATIPSFLPIEDVYVQPQYQPPNPEDEDDVVPDQHAAFGIARAMERRREAVWRDLGLEGLVNGLGHGGGAADLGRGVAAAPGSAGPGGSGPGATLRGSGGGAAAAGAPAIRIRPAGRRMGGRRTTTLR
ncbi:uncharacterized protein N7459_003229 [Penicillium hispanicum]|uniref:uncharacterized protein n=1 Tax=Penicillium hispanicum TaxID=1080232 RepID=UPI002541FCD1|nr:uncharacterized protein N7459_003229 [Penicillium hispanicum]KAJ5587464.1 hypothetical protein N7459_003229 [Penicillium hispanicum]